MHRTPGSAARFARTVAVTLVTAIGTTSPGVCAAEPRTAVEPRPATTLSAIKATNQLGPPEVVDRTAGRGLTIIPTEHSHLPARQQFPDTLEGWILAALNILHQHGIPGSFDGIHRNVIRESGGDPRAINLWDSNAARGTPSKGLLQVIDQTFAAYHVEGTSWDIYDPIANISAACNYAAHNYGSIDNVYSAY
ncbi:transglycosylase SLT domain-containing protein [Nocardia iowensis]|uniref:Transglycosylase SLT domain-containing protein n=1 Tax=Nocardia iowensis TaxID=204891 RepID=A0ABX8S257_NOCIO|nr:transglycosylase SLT domain-containing protein [Nocardia iowensis]QXN95606.1 transglycosylase SLT domain-containing protein [Nocardia iowensis]